ncbi:heavy metal translocating P-type ATPase [Phycisphaeraceae bacterium D3-23]
MKTTELHVGGMHCASCVAHVEKALAKVEGVETVAVNLTTERAAVSGRGLVVSHLTRAVTAAGYDAEPLGDNEASSTPRVDDNRRKRVNPRATALPRALWTLPIALALMAAHMAGLHHGAWPWLQLAGASLLMAVLGGPFFRGMLKGLRHGRADMDTLIALGSGVAYATSVVALFTGGLVSGGHFGTAGAILWFITLGHALEHKARRSAASAISGLRDLAPETATVVRFGKEHETPIAKINTGDTVLVKPGGRIPLDGKVSSGSSTIDQAMITGEPEPIDVKEGDRVFAGTINQTGSLKFTVTATGGQTLLGQIVEMVEQAQTNKAGVQRLADRVAGVFVPAVIAVALTTLVGWGLVKHDWASGLSNMIAVLIVACPCALGLAVPTAILVGTGIGARRGILIKDPAALERAGKLTHILLDKTGTLTTGKPQVTDIVPLDAGLDERALLRYAAGVEQDSEHPIGKALVKHYETTTSRDSETSRDREGADQHCGQSLPQGPLPDGRGSLMASPIDLPPVTNFTSLTAAGVRGSVEGKVITVGRLGALREHGVTIPDGFEQQVDQRLRASRTVVAVAIDNTAVGILGLADEVRPEAPDAVAALKKLGLTVVMLTGDAQRAADQVARRLDITRTLAEVKPADKRNEILRLHGMGKSCAMVGDGINDAPALAEADIGIAIGGGTDIARDAGHVVLVGSDLMNLPAAVRLGRATMHRIVFGLLWASIYNIFLIPLAVIGIIHPMFAALAMSLSSVSVVLNALWLRWRWED